VLTWRQSKYWWCVGAS